jgi:DNA-binding response OmpR family regulator
MPDEIPPTVLIVEHSETTRRILEHTFTAEGFVPVALSSVQEALYALKSIVPDVAVIQAVLPDASGLQVVQALRADAAYRNVPVLMMSGSGEERASLQGGKGSYAAIFDKPFSLKKMVATARELLGSRVA